MTDKILLHGLQFFGRHGCLPAECELGQKFVVDIDLVCDLQLPCQTDDLSATVDYVQLYDAAREVVEGKPVALLETLAQGIMDRAFAHDLVVAATVRIRKPHVAIAGSIDFVAVEITRTRKNAQPD